MIDAMLTKTDRKFLRHKEEYYTGKNAKQQRWERRENIRTRVGVSLDDFGILLNHLSESERKNIFGEYSGPNRRKFKNEQTREGVIYALAFLMKEAGVTSYMGNGRSTNLFKEIMLEALRRVGEKEGYLVQDFDPDCIEATRMPDKHLKDKLKRGDDLTSEELRYLIQQEGMEKEIQEQLRDQLVGEISD